MACPNCGFDNDSSQRFCVSCGTILSTACPDCGVSLPEGAQFCGSCGAQVPGSERQAATVDVPISPRQGLPESFQDGRYAVKSFLGQGAKKRVYLVDDTRVGRDVAFALIMTEDMDDTGRERVRREARAMGQLGDHPNLVQLYDVGEEDGQPYMVLPVMAGGSVDDLIRRSPDHQMPLERVIDVAKAVCSGLAFAHSKGFIHRDLKPSNVWLTEDGTAKIGDFGLALSATDPRLTQENMAVGTVAYMPPEQAMGGDVAEHSDLYSLGATLYEMVTGRPPFMGDALEAIIGQHINTPPVAPTWHNAGCPKALESLILRLLEKDPTARPESAGAVLDALENLERASTSDRMPVEVDGTNVLDSLAGGVFAGRQDEVGQMKDALEDALSGSGRLMMLAGEPGVGKTRTAQELAVYAGLRGARVVWGRCYEGDGAPPFWPWVQAIRSITQMAGVEHLRSAMGAGAWDIAEIVPEVRQRLGDLETPPALDDPQQARFRLFDSMATFLKNITRDRPLTLILDDLHEADKPSLLLLEFLAREMGSSRLLVIGTYRDAELTRRHPLSQTLGELAKESAFHRIQLRGMGREDVKRFIELTAGIEPSTQLVRAVYSHTDGNPLFVNEVVRLLVQEGGLARGQQAKATTEVLRIPEGVREAIGRRLDRLSEESNRALTVASVVGRSFSLDQLVRLIEDQTEDRLLEALEEALGARIIEELPQAVGHYQFTHALVRHTLADELSTTRRVRLHARIAEVLEDLYGADADAHSEEIAYHLGEAASAGSGGKLVHYSLTAGEQALASHAHEEAVTHFERALSAKEGEPVDAETATLLFGLGRAQAALL
ncbi:MAG: protein kinase, partial [Chloroflexi bacterium]|nr:protein kinase [Chloroflexota bacterium]